MILPGLKLSWIKDLNPMIGLKVTAMSSGESGKWQGCGFLSFSGGSVEWPHLGWDSNQKVGGVYYQWGYSI